MGALFQGQSGVVADVDPDRNIRVSLKPPGFGTLGAYSKALRTGAIAATGSANALIWAFRWTDATRLALVERVRVSAVVASTITTSVPYSLQLFFARSFTVSPTTNIGTTGTLSGNNAKRRTAMGATLVNGIWILGTAAAGMTGQTLGNDTDPLSEVIGGTGTAVGTNFFGAQMPALWDPEANQGPIVLQANEGLAIQAPLAGPATGTFEIAVAIDWLEVLASSYS